jgi:ketosteroid isomerase-like protein
MKKLLMILPLVFVLCFASSCQKTEEMAKEPAVDIEVELESIGDVWTAWTKASDAKDAEGSLACTSDDVDFVLDSTVLTKDGAREFWADHYSQGNYWTVFPLDKTIVSASGDMAYSVGPVQFTRMVEGEAKTGDQFYSIIVWKKQADGTWKIAALK